MKVVFLGRKPAASLALRHLVDLGMEVAAVVAPRHPSESNTRTFWRPLLRETARELGLPVVSDAALYALLAGVPDATQPAIDLAGVDLVLSFLFWKKIKPPLIALPRIGCFNFHPAPLPDFRACRGYNFAILEGAADYGGSIHWVSDAFDAGDLVEVRKFPMDPHETAMSLEAKTMDTLVQMFVAFMDRCLAGEALPRNPQGPGRSATKAELLAAMAILPTDAPEIVERKVRAFWYPPHTGATVEIGGRRYTLVDERTLSLLGRHLHGSRERPF